MARLVNVPTGAPSPAGSCPQVVTPRYWPLSLTAELPYAELTMALVQAPASSAGTKKRDICSRKSGFGKGGGQVRDGDGEGFAELPKSPYVPMPFYPSAGVRVGVQTGDFSCGSDEDLYLEGLLRADHLGCKVVNVGRGFGSRGDEERMYDGIVREVPNERAGGAPHADAAV
eukprot:15570325-Heterocapsa_arctica.AAC.1